MPSSTAGRQRASPVVRPLRRADLPAVVALRRRIWPDRIETPGSVAWALDHPDPSEHIRRWVATIDRVVVGSAAASRATWTPEPVAHVYVGVEPAWRGRGIGGAVVRPWRRHAATLGVSFPTPASWCSMDRSRSP